SPYSSACQALTDYLAGYFNLTPEGFVTSSNLAVSRARFQALGGFDHRFTMAAAEDRELAARWRSNGLPVIYAADAVVEHAHPLTLSSFAGLHFRYGRGEHHFRRRRSGPPERLNRRKFYGDLIRAGAHTTHRSWQIQGLLALSQLATAAGMLTEG